MQFTFTKLSFFLLIFGLFSACGSDAPQETEDDNSDSSIVIQTDSDEDGESVNINIDSDNLEDAMNQLADAFRSETGADDVEVMNFREIKEAFPGRLMGMSKTDDSGETTKVFGFEISEAEAIYEEDDSRITVKIVDTGNMGIAKLSETTWANVDIDKENDDGYERTIEIDGDKAFEKWNENSQKGELSLFYKGRYLVSIETRDVKIDDYKSLVRRLDLDELD